MAHAEAKSLGLPDLPICVLPHPMDQLDHDRVRLVAEQVVDDVVDMLTRMGR